jgi:hypothetical protein
MTLEAQSVFKVMQPAMIDLFIINEQQAFIKIIADVNELPPEMKNNNFPIMLNDEDLSMMIDSVPANPVEDGGVAVPRMDEKNLKGLCAKGYPNDSWVITVNLLVVFGITKIVWRKMSITS